MPNDNFNKELDEFVEEIGEEVQAVAQDTARAILKKIIRDSKLFVWTGSWMYSIRVGINKLDKSSKHNPFGLPYKVRGGLRRYERASSSQQRQAINTANNEQAEIAYAQPYDTILISNSVVHAQHVEYGGGKYNIAAHYPFRKAAQYGEEYLNNRVKRGD